MGKAAKRVFLATIVMALAALSCTTGTMYMAHLCEITGGTWVTRPWDPYGDYCLKKSSAMTEPPQDQSATTQIDPEIESIEPNSAETEIEVPSGEITQDQEAAAQAEEALDNPPKIDIYQGTSTLCDSILSEGEDWFGQKTSDEITISVDHNGVVNGLLVCTTNTGVRQVPGEACTYDGTNTITATLSGNLAGDQGPIQMEISWLYYVLRWNCPSGDGSMIDETFTVNADVSISGNKISGSVPDWYYPFTFEAYRQE